jgi:hypothetical protein
MEFKEMFKTNRFRVLEIEGSTEVVQVQRWYVFWWENVGCERNLENAKKQILKSVATDKFKPKTLYKYP